MSTPTSPSRANAVARRAGWPALTMRVSDADRAEVADRLAKHFGDGRLDQAEFELRLDRAMNAKTREDLVGLLADLPGNEETPTVDVDHPRRQRRLQRQLLKLQLERERLLLKHERREHRRREREHRWYSLGQLPVLIGAITLAVIVSKALRDIYSIWLVLALLAFLWLRHIQSDRNRRNRQ